MVFRHNTAEERSITHRRNPLTARPCVAFVVTLVICSTAVAFGGSRTGKDLPPGTVELSGSWLLLCRHCDAMKAAALKDYVTWRLTDGQEFNESLGFVRLPPRVAARAVRAVRSIP